MINTVLIELSKLLDLMPELLPSLVIPGIRSSQIAAIVLVVLLVYWLYKLIRI